MSYLLSLILLILLSISIHILDPSSFALAIGLNHNLMLSHFMVDEPAQIVLEQVELDWCLLNQLQSFQLILIYFRYIRDCLLRVIIIIIITAE